MKGKFDLNVKFEDIPIFKGKKLSMDEVEEKIKDIKGKFK